MNVMKSTDNNAFLACVVEWQAQNGADVPVFKIQVKTKKSKPYTLSERERSKMLYLRKIRPYF